MSPARLAATLVALVTAAACQVSPLDLGGAPMRCDGSHPCPDGLRCIDQSCTRLGAGANGVVCGATTCAAGTACCFYEGTYSCLGQDESCPGWAFLCDGSEDCDAGQVCCDRGTPSCQPIGECATRLCSASSQCPLDEPDCCVDDTYGYKLCGPESCSVATGAP
ncbi:MAG: hypothetical protein KA297_07745 [Kofleriaceae bacterium]|nr:hypothetical protein [Kofleriaceae bacterium]MBP6836016.1 hypothetical protein [Kofleriaceae bacterium]